MTRLAAATQRIGIAAIVCLAFLAHYFPIISAEAFVMLPWSSADAMSTRRPRLVRPIRQALISHDKDSAKSDVELKVDNRPHEQRAKGPRPARRLNHAFKYLYRHHDDHSDNANMTAMDYFMDQGYTREQIKRMRESFPPLLTLSVQRHLHPKMRFLKETLGLVNSSPLMEQIPPQYFGARLEAAIAPRHAFLVHQGLPHGLELLQLRNDGDSAATTTTLFVDFLMACRDAKRFAALCQTWQRRYKSEVTSVITSKQIQAFDVLFSRGIMAAARDKQKGDVVFKEGASNSNKDDESWRITDEYNITSGALIKLLIQHGANPRERDRRGATLVHWAAGTGNLNGLTELLAHCDGCGETDAGIWAKTERDEASPLHWAVAGCNARHFGIGGHVQVAQFLIAQVAGDDAANRNQYMNQRTKDGNSALMWAAWSGSLDCVKLLVQAGAESGGINRNGCSLAHWATSGGNLDVCRYLYQHTTTDFTAPNKGGHTPLTHAVAFGRANVVKWLKEKIIDDFTDDAALRLAQDFVLWKDDDETRRQVLNLFMDWQTEEGKS